MELHVRPVNDLMEHPDDACLCGPRIEQVDGNSMHVHHSLDGREADER
jgi:hypothetical protein